MVFEYNIYRCVVDTNGCRSWFVGMTDKFGTVYWREHSDEEYIEEKLLRALFTDEPPVITQLHGVEVQS